MSFCHFCHFKLKHEIEMSQSILIFIAKLYFVLYFCINFNCQDNHI